MSFPYQIRSAEEYHAAYARSLEDPEGFWKEVAGHFSWRKAPTRILDYDFSEPRIEWFADGELNLTENCLDRHLDALGDTAALLWEPNDPSEKGRAYTYRQLHAEVVSAAAALRAQGVEKGDRVILYTGAIPELLIAMLACARIGAIHSVVFGGFAAQALADRIRDAGARLVITCDGAYRGAKEIPLKPIVDEALRSCPDVSRVLVIRRTGGDVEMQKGRDEWWSPLPIPPPEGKGTPNPISGGLGNDGLIESATLSTSKGEETPNLTAGRLGNDGLMESATLPLGEGRGGAVTLDSEAPLFVLYTSGSTGKPKGVVHTTAGYMVWAAYTFVNVFQYQRGDVFFCTADPGWITGHTYVLYAPLLAGGTTLLFEGVPTWPDAGRLWEIIEKYKVATLYTAPTAIRSLMAHGLEPFEGKDLSSLKVLGSVGEPINEEAWHWYHQHVGGGRCPIVDTWWQTETGGILMSALAGITESKPAWAGWPLPGVSPTLTLPQGEGSRDSDPELETVREEDGKAATGWKGYETADTINYELLREKAGELKKHSTEAEHVLWNELRGKALGGFKFRRQHIIGKFIADFVCLKKSLVVELDGGIHNDPVRQVADAGRTEVLAGLDFSVLRFTNERVLFDLDTVLGEILAALQSAPDKPLWFQQKVSATAPEPLLAASSQPVGLSNPAISPSGGGREGALLLARPWPGILRTTWGDHERCRTTYFAAYPGHYFTGDGALRDPEGRYRITGRVDDVLNVSGHRIGTAELENAINHHPGVVESAVVGFPHDVKGQGIWAFVVVEEEAGKEPGIGPAINATVAASIGAIARADKIQIVPGLPKTRSGKIMRRILRKIAEGEIESLGDVSTLLDPGVVEAIVDGARQ